MDSESYGPLKIPGLKFIRVKRKSKNNKTTIKNRIKSKAQTNFIFEINQEFLTTLKI